MYILNKNGFLLAEALFALLIVLLCGSLLWNALQIFSYNKGWMIHKTIEKKWFYTD